MSARSRALVELAAHFERLATEVDGFSDGRPIYSGAESHRNAADMCRRTALENRWRERLARRLRIPWP